MTTETAVDLRRLHDGATPGPWRHYIDDYDRGTFFVGLADADASLDTFYAGGVPRAIDAKLIAETRNALPYLLDVVDAVRRVKRTDWYADALGRKSREAIDLWDAAVALDEYLRGER